MNLGSETGDRQSLAAATMRPLVVVSPYPPSKSGIAAYVSEIMPFHLREFDVTLVIADDAALPEQGRASPRILLASEFRKYRAHFENVTKLYHVGNNPDHCYMLDLMIRDPGIVVLHDFNLNYMHEIATQGWRPRADRFSPLEQEYGILGSEAARARFERKDRGLFATYELPMNGDVLEACTGVIAHSRYVQYRAAARIPHKPVWYVPHHLSPAVENYAKISQAEARRELGLPEDEIIVTAPGFITYAKRIPMLLSALATLRAQVPPFRLILAGERCPEQYDVDVDIAATGMIGIASCTGYVDEASFFKHLAACDIVANLRHPSGGETSGTLIRALGMGAPTVIFDNGPMAELPDKVVTKVAWDGNTEANLASALYELISDKRRRLEQGARAATYVRERHDVEKCAGKYAKVIESGVYRTSGRMATGLQNTFPHPKAVARRLQQLQEQSPDSEIDGRLWWRCAMAPLGCQNQTALVLGAHPQSTKTLLSQLFEWPLSNVTALSLCAFLESKLRDSSGCPVAQGIFSFALVVAPMDLPERLASTLVRRLNAAIRPGGHLTFEVWSALDADNEHASLAEERLPERLVSAGFGRVNCAATHDTFFSESDAAIQTRSAQRFECFTARKASGFALWRFNSELEGTPLRFGGRIN